MERSRLGFRARARSSLRNWGMREREGGGKRKFRNSDRFWFFSVLTPCVSGISFFRISPLNLYCSELEPQITENCNLVIVVIAIVRGRY